MQKLNRKSYSFWDNLKEWISDGLYSDPQPDEYEINHNYSLISTWGIFVFGFSLLAFFCNETAVDGLIRVILALKS